MSNRWLLYCSCMIKKIFSQLNIYSSIKILFLPSPSPSIKGIGCILANSLPHRWWIPIPELSIFIPRRIFNNGQNSYSIFKNRYNRRIFNNEQNSNSSLSLFPGEYSTMDRTATAFSKIDRTATVFYLYSQENIQQWTEQLQHFQNRYNSNSSLQYLYSQENIQQWTEQLQHFQK